MEEGENERKSDLNVWSSRRRRRRRAEKQKDEKALNDGTEKKEIQVCRDLKDRAEGNTLSGLSSPTVRQGFAVCG